MQVCKALLAIPVCGELSALGLDGGTVLAMLQRQWCWGSKANNWSMAAAPASQDKTGPRGDGRKWVVMHVSCTPWSYLEKIPEKHQHIF